MHRRSRLPMLGLVTLVACSSGHAGGEPPDTPPLGDARALVVAAPQVAPEIPAAGLLDRDGDRVDDRLDPRGPRQDERVRVEAIFSAPITRAPLDAFTRGGGVVTYVFRAVSYGFVGTIPRRSLASVARALGSSLFLLKGDDVVERHLDEATQTGRARPVWAASFGGGYAGAADINVAIMDTGVDGTHGDLAGRSVGWKDYTADDLATPTDVDGHGSHVAGIAVGTGAAFGLGPGPLAYTDSGDLSGTNDGGFLSSPVHLPASFSVTSDATWLGGGSTTLSLRKQADGAASSYSTVSTTASGASPLSLSFSGASSGERFTFALPQSGTTIGRFALANTIASYPAVGDGFPALRGVAPGSGWYGAKIFPTSGNGLSSDIGMAMDDIVVRRMDSNLKVCNMSFGIQGGGLDTSLRAKANTMVSNGIVVVVSNGNNGAGRVTADPGRAANVITVGATNDVDQLTQYTSAGITSTGETDDDKPDLLAPGGSYYRSRILSIDSNSADAASATFSDVRANDYASLAGTSMAAAFVSGAAVLVIDALQRSGITWSWTGTDGPFLVKSLLLATATETNAAREVGSGSPTLGRSSSPRDAYEGYGLLNPDAAIEAATLTYTDFSGTTTGSAIDRRAWGRRFTVPGGSMVRFDLDVSPDADFDVHLYATTPGAKGAPVLLAAGDVGQVGASETVVWESPTASTTIYVVVKHVSGSGTFSITSQTLPCCDTVVDAGGAADAAIVDAGQDASPPADGGVDAIDAGAPTPATSAGDASVADPGTWPVDGGVWTVSAEGGGCSCATVGSPRGVPSQRALGPSAIVALAALRRWRRRARL